MRRNFSTLCMILFLLLARTVKAYWFEDTEEARGDQGCGTYTCAWGDYDNDGDLDVFVGSSQTCNGSFLYQNNDGIFSDVGEDANLQFQNGNATASCWADYDNDGNLDLFVGGGGYGGSYVDTLYHNLGPDPGDGKYRFEPLIVGGFSYNTISAIWGDFNNDGWLDLYVINGQNSCKMFRNNGNGTFSSVACLPAQVIDGAYGAAAADFDNDGDLDILVTTYTSYYFPVANKLFINGGGWNDFTEEAEDYHLDLDTLHCTGAAFYDYDYDGDLDVFITRQFAGGLLLNNGGPSAGYVFTDVTESNGDIGDDISLQGAAWGDFDLDGDADIIALGGDRFYLNRYRESNDDFVESSADAGITTSEPDFSTAWADYDGDGKPDIYVGGDAYQGYNHLYRNQYTGAPLNRYLDIRLIGAESNRSGIGAHVVLSYLDDESNRTLQMMEVSGGGPGGGSQGSLPLEFGVGEASTIDSVMVYWPSGDTSFFEDVATNQRITIVEHGLFDRYDMTWDHNEYGHYYASGDITIEDHELEVAEGTNVYFHKTWRTNARPKLTIYSGATLTVSGTESDPVIFTSQYASPASDDWEGIYTERASSSISMDFARVSYCNYGLRGVEYYSYTPGSIDIDHCRFTTIDKTGIYLVYPSSTSPASITNSYFNGCGSYGIRITKDILSNSLDVQIDADTIFDCVYGISFTGNSNSSYTKIPEIENCILEMTSPPTYSTGISISSYSPSSPLVSPLIQSNSISGFKTGINLASVNSHCEIIANDLDENTTYGISMKYSSPKIKASLSGVPNVIDHSNTGIYCASSSPYVRTTKVKNCTYRSVYADASSRPNFGDQLVGGGNSFSTTAVPPIGYADMEYTGTIQIAAVANWWGEYPPKPNQIIGNIDYSGALTSDPLSGWKIDQPVVLVPSAFRLGQNYPNPFNPSTEISFALPEDGIVSLKIFNVNGQLIRTLVDGSMTAGEHTVIWNGQNAKFEAVTSGIYFYVLESNGNRDGKSMTLLR